MTAHIKTSPSYRKLALQAVLGAVVGAGASFATFTLLDDKAGLIDSPAQIVAIGVALVYLLIGLYVSFGVAAPKVGASLLNVDNAEELVDERANLSQSALVFVLMAVALGVIALGGRNGIAPPLAAAIAGLCLVGTAAATYFNASRQDEMMKSVGRDVAMLTYHVGAIIVLVWGGLAHLGLAGWISPLAAIVGLYILLLACTFWVIGRRGMFAPR